MGTIFIIEDEKLLAETIGRYLDRRGYRTHIFLNGKEGIKAYRENPPDMVLLDYRLPDKDGLTILRELKDIDPTPQVIIFTAYGKVETAVGAMKSGAYDYISKPVDLVKLEEMIRKIFENVKLHQEVDYLRGQAMEKWQMQGIIGNSEAVTKTIDRLKSLIRYDSLDDGGPTVLICGETGTGKGVFARAIHKMSIRSEKPFIEINCTAIPENLLESELFGYQKGAFTDARTSKAGLIEASEGGTLFLDEIVHLGLDMQAKLLKVVEEKTVRRLGDINDREINVKIIAATNRDLDTARKQGTFREDLYHRLNVIRIDLPPLRERDDDVLLLAKYFLDKYVKRYGKTNITGFSDQAQEEMLRYKWPGNVRELNNLIERAVLLGDDERLDIDHIGLAGQESHRSGTAGWRENNKESETKFDNDRFVLPDRGIVLEEVERDLMVQALERARWNRGVAAKLLGISMDTLRYRIKKYDLLS